MDLKKVKKCNIKLLFLILLIFGTLLIIMFHFNLFEKYTKSDDMRLCSKKTFSDLEDLKSTSRYLIKLTRHIVRAHRYSRHNYKTISEMNQAFLIAQRLIRNINYKMIEAVLNGSSEKNGTLAEFCPEVYISEAQDRYHYPRYVTDNENCKGQLRNKLFSVLINAVDDINLHNLKDLLIQLDVYYHDVDVLVAHDNAGAIEQFKLYRNFVPLKLKAGISTGAIWRSLAENASTKYIFIARKILRVDYHTSFERLLRFLSYGIAEAVGSSHRYTDGRWFRGCHATAMRNYTLKFVDGYDLSHNSCIYCDYLTGPFVINRELFLELADNALNRDTFFVDLFASLSRKSQVAMSCPDQMFEIVDRQLQDLSKVDWIPLMKKWKLNRIIFSNRQDLRFSCEETGMQCAPTPGLITPLCCYQELVDMVKFISETCDKLGMDLELEAGSNVGAAKMYGIVPYERDADFNFDIRHHVTFAGLSREFQKRGYTIKEDKNDYKCVNTSAVNCGYFAVKNAYWNIEMWGVNFLSSQAYRLGVKNHTRVNIDGYWVKCMFNPAQSARNEYGDDIYQHVEHWYVLGYKTGWVQLNTGNWAPCPQPGFHGCLDLYIPVGDIHYRDVSV